MIDAKELRIGNKIKRISNGSWCTVNWGIIKEAELGEGTDYEPIELTTEILEKAGCKLVNGVYWTKDGISYEDTGTSFSASIGIGTVDLPRSITTVHQLQNYHYALTGHELNIHP